MSARHWSAGYIGIPYLRGGRDRSGLDCWGITYLALREAKGIDVPAYTEVPASPAELEEMSRAIADITSTRPWRRVARPDEFDVALFRTGEHCAHVGLVAGSVFMLHTTEGSYSRLERLDAVHWRSRLVGYFRHEDLAEAWA